MTEGIGQGFAGGSRGISGKIFTHQLAGQHPTGDRHVVEKKRLGLAEQLEGVSPVLPVVRKIGELALASKTCQPNTTLRIKRLHRSRRSRPGKLLEPRTVRLMSWPAFQAGFRMDLHA